MPTDGIQIALGLRVVEGSAEGLSSKWTHGTGQLRPGGITFRGTVGGLRFLRRAPIELPIVSINRSHQRTPTGGEIISVNADSRVVRLATEGGILECAVRSSDVPTFLDEIGRSAST